MNRHDLRALPLRLAGWKFETDLPAEKKYVCLAVPHTSNWDGVLLLALAQSVGLKMSWMIKGEWVRGPVGIVLARLGAVAIDRGNAGNVVPQMIEELRTRDALALVIPPEGTRGRTDHWKSGFYRIALGAGVPVRPGYLDYKRKRAGIGPAIHLTGDVHADMDKIRAYYETSPASALYADHVGPIRLKEEASGDHAVHA
ncbi:MAG: 1-acyl-sn-glycerol-3-phosphate acyltransferase [Deltaproteobacteria bacterium]